MYDKNMYKETFSMLGASGNTLTEVLEMTKGNRKPYRLTRAALIAAIVVLMLGMATVAMAYSGAGNWFLGFFRERAGKELTPGQQQLIEDETVDIGSSVMYSDVTITVESVLCDDRNAYIVLRIEAPEGFDLGGEGFHFRDESFGFEYSSMGLSYTAVEDDSGKANILGVLIEVSVIPLTGSDFSFRDGVVRTLTLMDICMWPNDGVTGSVVLIEGTWSFDIAYSDSGSNDSASNSIELITGAVTCYGTGLMGDSQEVLLTSFRLDVLGAIITYKQLPDAIPEALDFMGILVVMKDGSSVQLLPQSGSVGVFTLRFGAPIVLSDVDYIRFPDGVMLPDAGVVTN